jgi:hypothetical protein
MDFLFSFFSLHPRDGEGKRVTRLNGAWGHTFDPTVKHKSSILSDG